MAHWRVGGEAALSHALHQAQPGHGVDAQAVPVVHGYVGKLALAGGNPAVDGLGQQGAELGAGEGALGLEGSAAGSGQDTVGGQPVDLGGVGGAGCVGKAAVPVTGEDIPPHQLLHGGVGPAVGAAGALQHPDAVGQSLQQSGKGVPVRFTQGGVQLHIPAPVEVDTQIALRGALGAGGGEKGGDLGGQVGVHQQVGDQAHGVGGGAGGGVEAVTGDLDGVPVGEVVGQGALVQNRLGHSLAEGAPAHQDAGIGVPDVGGEQLGGAGGLPVGEDDDGGEGAGVVVAAIRAVGAGAVLEVGQHAGAGEAARRAHGRVYLTAAVAPEIDDPVVSSGGGVLHAADEVGHRLAAEGVAVDVADVAVPQLGIGGGDGDGPAGEDGGVLRPVPPVGQLHPGAGVALEPGGHSTRVLPGGGAAVHGGDQITGLEAGVGGRGVLIDPLDQRPVRRDQRVDAYAHGIRIGHGAGKGPVLLGREVGGVGVAQGLQHGLDGVLVQNVLGDLVDVIVL